MLKRRDLRVDDNYELRQLFCMGEKRTHPQLKGGRKRQREREVLTSSMRQVMKGVFSVGGLGACNWCRQFPSEEERQLPTFDVCSMCFQSSLPSPPPLCFLGGYHVSFFPIISHFPFSLLLPPTISHQILNNNNNLFFLSD